MARTIDDYYLGQTLTGTIWHILRPTEGSNKRRSPAFCGATPRQHLWSWLREPGMVESDARICKNCEVVFGWPAVLNRLIEGGDT